VRTVQQTIRDVVWKRVGIAGWLGWILLLPFSWLFAMAVILRDLGYRSGLLRVERASIPVVSVGNLAVGGTGKTPITLWLARQLRAAGLNVAIVLRGYSGSATTATVVSEGAGPLVSTALVGDEAIMLAKCFDGPVLTASRRFDGVQRAAALGCDVAVLDDGFQHRALHRDFDLVLVNHRRRGFLPAGPLRESWGALHRADAVALVCKDESDEPAEMSAVPASKPVFVVRFAAQTLIEADAGTWRERPVNTLSGRHVAVVSGIAEPAAFYATVRQWEGQVEEIFEYPDHHHYSEADWQQLLRKTRDIDLIVTTEKDLVKLESFPFARGKLVAIRLLPQVERGEELVRLVLERTGLIDKMRPQPWMESESQGGIDGD